MLIPYATSGLVCLCQRTCSWPLTPPHAVNAKMPPNASKSTQFDCKEPQPKMGFILGSKTNSEGTYFTTTPAFCGFHPAELPKWTPRPLLCVHCWAKVGPTGSLGGPKGLLPKLFPDHLRTPNKCFWSVFACFDRVLSHFGPPKASKTLEPSWDQNGVKRGGKHISESDCRPLGMPKPVLLSFSSFWPSISFKRP